MTPKNTIMPNQKKSSQLIEYKAGDSMVKLSPSMVKDYLVSGDSSCVTEQEIVMFINLCKFQGLNPFLREAYLIKYKNQPATIVTGKSAFEKRASRCEKYRGFRAGIVVLNDGGVENREGTIVLNGEMLVGGWADVFVAGYEHPVHIEVSINEYIGRKNDGSVNKQWSTKPATMIRKVAKMQALREAFPENFQGMYVAEEAQVEEPLTEVPIEQPQIGEESPGSYIQQQEEIESQQDDFAKILEG